MVIAERVVDSGVKDTVVAPAEKPNLDESVKVRVPFEPLKASLRVIKERRDVVMSQIGQSPQFIGAEPAVQAVVRGMSAIELLRLQIKWRGNDESFRNLVRRSLSLTRRGLLKEEILYKETIEVILPDPPKKGS